MTNTNPTPTADKLRDRLDDHSLTEDNIIQIATVIRSWGDELTLAEAPSPEWLEGFRAAAYGAAEYLCRCASINTPLRDTLRRLLDEGLDGDGSVDMS